MPASGAPAAYFKLMYFSKRQIFIYFKILCLGLVGKSVVFGSAMIGHSINSGGGWITGSQHSTFTNFGEIYMSTQAQPGQFNQPPTDLNATGSLVAYVNQPVGTIVGQFIATDPDGDILTYHFVSGDNNNSLFTLDENGTLRTAVIFDYSLVGQVEIRVRVTAQNGLSTEKTFMVEIKDVLAPIVETGEFEKLNNGGVKLKGIVLDNENGAKVLERGFYVSRRNIVNFDRDDVFLIREDGAISIPANLDAPIGYQINQWGGRGELTWSKLAQQITDARLPYGSLVNLNEEVYLVGGSRRKEFRDLTGGRGDKKRVERYDTDEMRWVKLASLPNARFRHACTVLGGKIYAIGGAIGGNVSASVVVYDPAFDRWVEGISLPEVVENGRAIVLNGSIYFIGGENKSGGLMDIVYRFRPGEMEWERMAPMPSARSGVRLVVYNERIWAIGNDEPGAQEYGIVESYDPLLDNWRREESLPKAVNYAWAANGTIYCGLTSNEIYSYNPVNKEWSFLSTAPFGVEDRTSPVSSIVVGGKINLLGGPINKWGTNLNLHYVADLKTANVGYRDLYIPIDGFNEVVNDSRIFTANVGGWLGSGTFYYISFVRTEEGISYGLEEEFTLPRTEAITWLDATAISGAQNWWNSPWFGSFYRGDGEEWIMHAGLGWLYPSPSYGGGGWFWNEDLKWVWTNSEHYPFLFSNTGGAWLYFYGKHRNEILFYHYGENKWIVNRL